MNKSDKECILRALQLYRCELYQTLRKYRGGRDYFIKEYITVDRLYRKILKELFKNNNSCEIQKED